MKWKASKQMEFLKRMDKTISGTNDVLVGRISDCILIDKAVEIVTAYRIFLETK